jgi:hypothetical protein
MPTGMQEPITGLLCILCDEIINEPYGITELVCEDCQTDAVSTCEHCGMSRFDGNASGYRTEMILGGSNIYVHYFVCTEDTIETLCIDCAWRCECGNAYSSEEEYLECCQYDSGYIHNYSYRPTMLFYEVRENSLFTNYHGRPGVLFMGAEIEIAKFSSVADEFIDSLNTEQKDFVYLKEDASIGSDGAELVTMPATLDAFAKVFPFEELDEARKMGARSFAYSSCGFHIHVARSAFSATHLWRFVKFQLNNPELCQFIAQRETSSYATWDYEESERSSLPDYVKGKKSNGRRYLAINFQNYDTVELRYFKGNILESAILKNMEFVQSVYDYTKDMSIRAVMQGGLSESSYHAWLEQQNAYENLKYFIVNSQSQESY